MASEWIKMRKDLRDDPSVIGIASRLDIDEDLVVGKLHRLWSWADSHTSDGNAASVTKSWVDRYVGVSGFAQAMVAEGWLAEFAGGVSIPNFDRHMGKSAKKRALTSNRVTAHRGSKCNADSVTKALPEKRREEKNKEEKKETWLTPFFDLWKELYDSELPKIHFPTLKKLHDRHGSDKTIQHLRRYLNGLTDPSFINIPKFASTFGGYNGEARHRAGSATGPNLGRVQAEHGKYAHKRQTIGQALFEKDTQENLCGTNGSEHSQRES